MWKEDSKYIVSREKLCVCYCYPLGLQGGAGVWAIYLLVIHGDKEDVSQGWTFFSCLSESFRLKGGLAYLYLLLHWLEATTLPTSISGSKGNPALLGKWT